MYFGNGVNVTALEADAVARDALPGLADEAAIEQPIFYSTAYNQTNGLFNDVIETFQQKAAEDSRFSWFVMNNALSYLVRGVNVPTGILDGLPGGDAFVAQLQQVINLAITNSNAQSTAFYDADVAQHVAAYAADLLAGYRVIVIAHSQGNLYANAARVQLQASVPGLMPSFGIDAVATPAETAANGYTTSDTDLVIGSLRKLGHTVLPANVHVPALGADFTGHLFEATYINAALPARASVVSVLAALGKGLVYPPAGCANLDLGAGTTASVPFLAVTGQSVLVRVAGVGSVSSPLPALVVLDPDGIAVAGDNTTAVAAVSFRAEKSGTFTAVVSDASGAMASGEYNVYLTTAPGSNEGGLLVPGEMVTDAIDKGDLDSYTFQALAGQGVQLRCADLDGGPFAPAITVYDPSGYGVVGAASGPDVAVTSFTTSADGTYTVVISDQSPAFGGTGRYNLYFTRAPGANEGGLLNPGEIASSTIEEGDLDSYTFEALAGQGISLHCTDTSGGPFTPTIAVYDPTGATVVNAASGPDVAATTFTAGNAGIYTIVIGDLSIGYASTGSYDLAFTLLP